MDTFIEQLVKRADTIDQSSVAATVATTATAATGAEDSLANPLNQKAVLEILTKWVVFIILVILGHYHFYLCCCLLCFRAQAITDAQTKVVTALIDADDAAIRRVFLRYEKEKDLSKLISYLRNAKLHTYALSVSQHEYNASNQSQLPLS